MRVPKGWPLLLLVLSTSVLASPHPLTASAASAGLSSPVYQVDLDANSISQTDVNISPSALQESSFRIGAVISSSSTAPLARVFGWQIGITYNATAFVPQGEIGSSSDPDQVGSAALFGSQTSLGSVNWAGKITSGTAFAGSNSFVRTDPHFPYRTGTTGEILVFFTHLAPATAVSISANTLLANVNFEIVSKPSTPQFFNITDVLFVDDFAVPIIGPAAGHSAIETITNDPPHAVFTATADPRAGAFAYLFNATSSYDSDGTIPNPTGYFWDFGDGNQDLGVTGSVLVHDYGVNGSFVPTLRVRDSQGATGAARDSLGNIVLDNQPSHERRVIGPPPADGPIAVLNVNNPSPVVNQGLFFNGRQSSDHGGSIIQYSWSFGDGSQFVDPFQNQIGDFYNPFYYHLPGNYTVTLTITDNRGYSANATTSVRVRPRPLHDLGIFYLEAVPNRVDSSWNTTIIIGVTNYGLSDENSTLTVYQGPNVIASLNKESFPAGDVGTPCSQCASTFYVGVSWNTSGVAPANYTITATFSLTADPSPSDNTASNLVQVLPFQPSTLSTSSSKVSLGDWLVLTGSNFPYHQAWGSNVQILLDGKFAGYAVARPDGTFSEPVFIPDVHTGTHIIEVQDISVGAHASLVIHVVPPKATTKQGLRQQVS